MPGEKDFKVRITARDDGFGATLKKAKADLDSTLSAGGSFASSISGGLLGGGVVGFFLTAVDKITVMLREASHLAEVAKDIGVPGRSVISTSRRALALGADREQVFSSMDTAGKARADALAGEPAAIAAFNRLGFSLDKIKQLAPDELFFQIAESLKGAKLDAEKVVASRRVFGGSADALMPFFVAGSSFRMDPREASLPPQNQLFTGLDGWKTLKAWLNGEPNPHKADLDPVSTYPLEREQATARLKEANALRVLDLARSQLSTEEQINDLLGQRASIISLIESAKSGFRQEQLISIYLDIEQKLLRLREAQAASATSPKTPAFQRNLDEFYRAGIFTGGRPLEVTGAEKELKITNEILRGIPHQIARVL